ncbi:MAG: FAD-dependent oxidoreductase [Alphaproteobacteria bacterium]|nr:FAD-dependent oxidoreductase [Alphaproteobacteria bacterium]
MSKPGGGRAALSTRGGRAALSTRGGRAALVVGGSLGGLLAANLLLRAGWQVRIAEKVAGKLEGRGAGIITHDALFAALRRAGVTVGEDIGVGVAERVALAPDGRTLARLELSQILSAWGHLHALLRAAFPVALYRQGLALESLSEEAGQIAARFEDGSVERADLVVAADGIRSTARRQFAPAIRPRYAGYVAWRGLVEEARLSPAMRAELFPRFGFCLPPGEHMLGYPVPGAGESVVPGRRRYNFVWYRPAPETGVLADLLTDARGKRWDEAIPPPLIRPEILAAARADAARLLAPGFAEAVAKTEGLFFQPIYDVDSAAMAFGRVALLGDAAFVARPHVGMGVTKAAEDALALVEALAVEPDVPAALSRYQAARLAVGKRVVARARRLGASLEARARGEAPAEPPIEQVIAEIAVPAAAAL